MKIIDATKKGFSKAVFAVRKHSPEILIVAGVVGTVASAVMACIATTKVNGVIEDAKRDIDIIHDTKNACDNGDEEATAVYADNQKYLNVKYSEKDMKKDLTIVYVRTGLNLVKLYGPSIALGTLSLTGVIASNVILKKRNIGLAAAYATIDKSFKEYRGRVVERFGERVDYELRNNIKAVEIEKTVTDEKGKEKTVKETVDVKYEGYSDYSKIFDELNPYYDTTPSYNQMFLKAKQAQMNDKLRAQGYLFLNDVYEALGFEKTKAGQVVGWVYNPDSPESDNYVDFGYDNIYRKSSRDFMNGYDPAVILDFNVDGTIWDKVTWESI